MFTRIKFDENKYEHFKVIHIEGEFQPNELTGLSRLNIFIGENNSGKSRFLRRLFSDKEFDFDFNDFNLKTFNVNVLKLYNMFKNNIYKYSIINTNNLDSTINKIHSIKSNNFYDLNENIQIVHNIIMYITNISDIHDAINRNRTTVSQPSIHKQLLEDISILGSNIKSLTPKFILDPQTINFQFLYIPILRGLRPIQLHNPDTQNFNNQYDNYKQRTMIDYFPNDKNTYDEIFSGLNLYNDIKHYKSSDKSKRNKIRKFENFLSKTFFSNKEIYLVPQNEKDVLFVEIGEEDDRAIYEMGDGIQAIIIMLYPLFLNQDKNLMVFIEEPEISLHPGMQRIFIEALLRPEFENFQYFITTHSNHFLDITLDLKEISIYTFQKKYKDAKTPIYEIQNTNNEDIRILDLIGARNSSVFLSNCTIWVEGITDRLYLRKYLEVYQNFLLEKEEIKEKFREDIHFSFIEYGGGNIVHWSFSDAEAWGKIKASSISNKIFLIADKDYVEEYPDSEKAKRLDLLRENLKENFRVVDGREIENTLSPSIIINTIEFTQKNKKKLEYDPDKIVIENYKDLKLASFIQANFKNLDHKYEGKYGALANKVTFCQTAITQIKSFEDLSSEGVNLAKAIFEFIKKNNPK